MVEAHYYGDNDGDVANAPFLSPCKFEAEIVCCEACQRCRIDAHEDYYYGCLLLRPSRELGFDDPENPTIMEDFLQAIGAEPVIYAMRNE
ncbi:MAG: hypothetical protein KIG59_04480, partial [Muribaculaceae bacterium]|nr:hypothetical protein [Muribaculaceae bacterium]